MIRQLFRRGVRFACIACALLLCCAPTAVAQEPTERERKNSVFAELLGAGWGLNVNYERVFTSRISAHLGGGNAADGKPSVEFSIGAPPIPSDYSLLAAADVVLLGQRRHQLFAGTGVRVLWIRYGYKPTEAKGMVLAELGYRYCSKSGFVVKATLAGTSREWSKPSPQWVMPGVSLGWAF